MHTSFLLYVILQVFTALFLQFVRGLGESVKYTVASFISATTTTILNVIALVILKMGLKDCLFPRYLHRLLH